MKYLSFLWCLLVILCFSCTVSTQGNGVKEEPPLLERIYTESSSWVDSVMMTLSEDQKIAQLFWLSISYPVEKPGYSSLHNLTAKHQPGGLLIMRMEVEEAYDVIADLQSVSEVPLLVSIDGETGLYMRMREVIAFPEAMTLGAIANDSLIYCMGLEMARQMHTMGIHVNMAPVADVNSNPNNPVIGMRSFGEVPANVSQKSVAVMRGLQDGRVMAVGKHFPGHGDTSTDSHYTLPVVDRSREELDSVELKPFKILVDEGIWGMMTAHMHIPSLEPINGIPTSFSKVVIEEILRTEMDFKGLVITDAMNMQGAKFMGKPGEIDALALAAGNDIVEFTEDLSKAISSVKLAIADSLLSWKDIEEKCRRSLAFKYWLIHTYPASKVAREDLTATINSPEAKKLNQELYDAALTVLKLDENIPRTAEFLKDSTAVLVVGDRLKFDPAITDGFSSSVFYVSTESEWNAVHMKLKGYKHYAVVISNSRWGLKSANNVLISKVTQFISSRQSTVIFMGNPYHISRWKNTADSNNFILTYQNSNEALNSAFKFLSGKMGSSGKLPVSVHSLFEVGSGEIIE